MEYQQTYSSRDDLFWRLFSVIFLLPFGLTSVVGFFYFDFHFLAFIVGVVLLFAVLLTVYGIAYSTVWTGVITPEEIRCLDNGVLKQIFKKNDIEKIQAIRTSVRGGGPNIAIRAYMEDGDTELNTTVYFMNIGRFMRDLKACGYIVEFKEWHEVP